jgi:hypothetical protein
MGLIVAKPEYLTAGLNRDAKASISAAGKTNIWWLLKDLPYPRNFWRHIDQAIVERICTPLSGNARMVALFKELADQPIPRKVVESVAAQQDFMRRVRGDNKRGTRDRLAGEGFVVLSGKVDKKLIQELRLPHTGPSEFISHQVRDERERDLARAAGHAVATVDPETA